MDAIITRKQKPFGNADWINNIINANAGRKIKEGHIQGAKFKCGDDWKGKSKIVKTFAVGEVF